jgi:hypothetical protein
MSVTLGELESDWGTPPPLCETHSARQTPSPALVHDGGAGNHLEQDVRPAT